MRMVLICNREIGKFELFFETFPGLVFMDHENTSDGVDDESNNLA